MAINNINLDDYAQYFNDTKLWKTPSVSEMILDVKQKSLYETIALGEKSFDDLYESTGLTVEELNMHLTDLEFSGLIKQLPGRVYTVS